jgi:hypothetical protein
VLVFGLLIAFAAAGHEVFRVKAARVAARQIG